MSQVTKADKEATGAPVGARTLIHQLRDLLGKEADLGEYSLCTLPQLKEGRYGDCDPVGEIYSRHGEPLVVIKRRGDPQS